MFNKKWFALFISSSLILSACLGPLTLPNQELVTQNGNVQAVSIQNPQAVVPAVSEQTTTEEDHDHADTAHHSDVDLTHLEVGDGKYSTSPQMGYVYTCMTNFNGGGAQGTGNWMNGDGTWDATKKAVVDGSVTWPSSFTISLEGDQRIFTGNDLPNHPTGNFPVSSSDDAYLYDRNPNSISTQSIRLALPATPAAASQPNCVGGEVGIMLSGVVIFSAFDAEGRDAVAHEVQDNCDGHPQRTGFYHYHSLSDCIVDESTSGHSSLVGYAFDGYGIYGYYGEDGAELTNEDLDECHGHAHMIEWDGQMVEMYHYHATHEFPYVVGCFHGTPAVRALSAEGGQGQGNQGQPQQSGQLQPAQNQTGVQGNGGQPPQEAINACIGLSQGASCSVGNMSGTCMTPPNTDQLACVPSNMPHP